MLAWKIVVQIGIAFIYVLAVVNMVGFAAYDTWEEKITNPFAGVFMFLLITAIFAIVSLGVVWDKLY